MGLIIFVIRRGKLLRLNMGCRLSVLIKQLFVRSLMIGVRMIVMGMGFVWRIRSVIVIFFIKERVVGRD